MNNAWKEWFVFTKKERTGIIVLVSLILAATCLPRFFSAVTEIPDKTLTRQIDKDLLLVQGNTDSLAAARNSRDESPQMTQYDLPAEKKPLTFFEFDPNTLSVEGWRKLGLRDRSIQIIRKYLSRGGKFREPGDLKKIYGLSKEMAARLIPYVRIQLPKQTYEPRPRPEYKPSIIEINTADTAALIALPGIGSKLARRIISFRDKLGGFYSVEQVKETYGLPDSTFQIIRARLHITAAIKTINVNTAKPEHLSSHPYIGRNLANAIVRYREQHGPYSNIEDIKQIVLVTPEIFQKIVYYLAVQE